MGDAPGALVYRNGGRTAWLSGWTVSAGYGWRRPDSAGQFLAIINRLWKSAMAPGGRPEASRHSSCHGSGRDDRSGMAGDWPNGTMGIRGFHADYPAAGRGPGPGAAMASVAPANYVAGASAHARPYRASAPQLWLTASTYWQAGQVRALTLARHIDETRTSTQN